jgi:hypothetical protein
MRKLIIDGKKKPVTKNFNQEDIAIMQADAAADAAFNIVDYHKEKIQRITKDPVLSLLIEAIEDELGLDRGKLIANAKAKVYDGRS